MLLRLGLSTLLLAASPLGRGCAPTSLPGESETTGPSVAQPLDAASAEEREEVTPPLPQRTEFKPGDVSPSPPDSPNGLAGAALRSALSAMEEGRFEDVLTLLPDNGTGAISELQGWTRARALTALDRGAEADPILASIPTNSRFAAEALLNRAQIALNAGTPDDVLRLLGPFEVPTRYRPQDARADLLRARALKSRGQEGDVRRAVLAALRVWRQSPGGQPDGDAQVLLDVLEPQVAPELRRDLSDSVARAQSYGKRHGKRSIVDLLTDEKDALIALGQSDPGVSCTGLFELGRAYHKQRKYSDSVPVLNHADGVCKDDEHVKTLYLLAQGRARSGQVSKGITTFLRLPAEHTDHSYADDGLWQASRLALDEGRHAEAAEHAQRLVDSFPDGDMRGSTLWNLAWSSIASGRDGDALPWLEVMSAGDPLGPDREHVLQGRYWMARVLLKTSPDRRDVAMLALQSLATDQPLHWYGTLAGWLLSEEDPARAAETQSALRQKAGRVRGTSREPARYEPLREFAELPGIQAGIVYLRAGLPAEAAEEFGEALGTDAHSRWTDPQTLLFASHLLAEAKDPARSHNLLRRAYKSAFPPASSDHAPSLMHAFPEAFSEVIDGHTAAYDWDPMLFQGLVREESAFSPTVVSWAGAIGLSQLMWPTAKETARRMGVRVSRASLRDPSTNVRIGTTYFEGLNQRWKGHLPLAVASYNAGPGAVNKWVKARGHLELDAWVETIPYDQTRHYVKRVVSSWQAYRFLYGQDSTWVPLRIGAVVTEIEGSDPPSPGQTTGG